MLFSLVIMEIIRLFLSNIRIQEKINALYTQYGFKVNILLSIRFALEH
jgi:hypothetical protein